MQSGQLLNTMLSIFVTFLIRAGGIWQPPSIVMLDYFSFNVRSTHRRPIFVNISILNTRDNALWKLASLQMAARDQHVPFLRIVLRISLARRVLRKWRQARLGGKTHNIKIRYGIQSKLCRWQAECMQKLNFQWAWALWQFRDLLSSMVWTGVSE